MTTKPTIAPADVVALLNEVEHPAQARHVAGQHVMKRPKLLHLMHLAADNDERGLDALIALAVHNNRYPKGE